MKKHKALYRLLFIIASIVLLDQWFGLYLDHKQEQNKCDYCNGKINFFVDQEQCDTLFIGSSRVLHSIKPQLVGPNSRILGYQNKDICHNVALYDIISSKKRNPSKTLVFNIDLDDLFTPDQRLLERVYSLKYFYTQNDFVRSLIDRIGYEERIKFVSRLYKHNGNGWKLIARPITNNCKTISLSGYEPLIPGPLDSIRLAKSIEEDFKQLDASQKQDLIYEMLNHLKSLTDQQGVELIVINAPYYTIQEDWFSASKEFGIQCKKTGIKYIDFNQMELPELENRSLWYDNMHLNDDGASIFSKIIGQTLKFQQFTNNIELQSEMK